MTVELGDIIRVSCRCDDINGNDLVNVFHLKVTEVVDGTPGLWAVAIVDYMEGAFSQLNNVQSEVVEPVDIKIDVVTWDGADETVVENIGTYTWGTPYVPGAAGDPLPPGVAGFVKFLTHLGKVYGRKFIGGMLEAGNVSGYYNSGVVDALELFAGEIISGLTSLIAGEAVYGVLSKKLGTFVEAIALDVPNVYAYQRRRRQGSGS